IKVSHVFSDCVWKVGSKKSSCAQIRLHPAMSSLICSDCAAENRSLVAQRLVGNLQVGAHHHSQRRRITARILCHLLHRSEHLCHSVHGNGYRGVLPSKYVRPEPPINGVLVRLPARPRPNQSGHKETPDCARAQHRDSEPSPTRLRGQMCPRFYPYEPISCRICPAAPESKTPLMKVAIRLERLR